MTNQQYSSIIIWLRTGIGSDPNLRKYGFGVIEESSCIEVLLIWPKHITDTDVITDASRGTGCILEDSEDVRIKHGIHKGRKSTLQSIESVGNIGQPSILSANTTERYNMRITDRGSLLVLVRFTVHMEHGQIDYDEGSFSVRLPKRVIKIQGLQAQKSMEKRS